MKKTLLPTFLMISFGALTAHANDLPATDTVSGPFASVSVEAVENLKNCLNSDIGVASSKAIRACSKAYRDSIPDFDVRSDILTRRGLLQLSAGRFEKAGRDFEKAARLSGENEFAYLGQGYAAMMERDYASAEKLFKDCSSHDKAAPLAIYGLAMTKELSGDLSAARFGYQRATEMRPDWKAPRAELARMKSAI